MPKRAAPRRAKMGSMNSSSESPRLALLWMSNWKMRTEMAKTRTLNQLRSLMVPTDCRNLLDAVLWC